MYGKLKKLPNITFTWKMTSIARWAIFLIPLQLIILMTNEALKLVHSKQNNGPIIPMYTINIHMDLSIYIVGFIFKIILHNISFVKNNSCKAQKNQN
jgi:hypothetical protein